MHSPTAFTTTPATRRCYPLAACSMRSHRPAYWICMLRGRRLDEEVLCFASGKVGLPLLESARGFYCMTFAQGSVTLSSRCEALRSSLLPCLCMSCVRRARVSTSSPFTCDICKLCCAAGLSLEIFKISYGADCVLQPFLIYSIETHVTLHGFPIP